jgi:hypothetical protein
MKEWFSNFKTSMFGDFASSDLIGAGNSSPEEALDHYRFQHEEKIKETVESTFSELVQRLDDQWGPFWDDFWKTRPLSPRSLDFYPQLFLHYVLSSELPSQLQELTQFEHILDTYSWSHAPVKPCSLENLSGQSRILLGEYELIDFKTPVIETFLNTPTDLTQDGYKVLFWLTNKGVEFRAMKPWEIEVLKRLDQGIGHALESAPEDPEAVNALCHWLASSGLISHCSLECL